MTDRVIEVSNLTVRYGRNLAVDNVTLDIDRGVVYALLGRNGAGKSSLIRCLLGQLRPDGGALRMFGDDVWRHRTALMQRVGVVTEEADAPPEMSVGGLARFCRSLYARWDQPAFEARMRAFGVPLTSRFGALSKGQKKQVSLALALAMSPDLIILDDPTLGLDVVARRSLFEEVIGEMADRGITVFITTHDLAGVETFADRIGIMKRGRLVLDEGAETLKSRFRRIRFAAQQVALETGGLAAAAVRSWGSGAEAIVSNYDDIAFERFRTTSGMNAADIAPMSLEEIFVAVSGESAGGMQ
jgi:ABC-2 type transport system ATP-binding protein